VAEGNQHVYNQYTIRAERRDDLRAHLEADGIGSGVYYPVPLHEQACFSSLGCAGGDFPESERAATEVLSLPVFPELTADQRARVAESVRSFYTPG
jgi:dTDP-4-amino-4,6-dideoxygalactose transaminase